jgi:hypothetical protein
VWSTFSFCERTIQVSDRKVLGIPLAGLTIFIASIFPVLHSKLLLPIVTMDAVIPTTVCGSIVPIMGFPGESKSENE